MGFATLGIILALCAAFVNSGNSTTTGPPGGCMLDGVHYNTGEYHSPTPCKSCYCQANGQMPCAIGDCFVVPCVDPVPSTTKCCPDCPNGHNCRAPDGTTLQEEEKYTDATVECTCGSQSYGPMANVAVCRHLQLTPTMLPQFTATPPSPVGR